PEKRLVKLALDIIPEYINLSIVDKKVVSMALKDFAKKKGKTPDEIKKELLEGLDKVRKKEEGILKEVAEALYHLVKNERGQLILEITNKYEMSIKDLLESNIKDPKDFLKYFDIKIRYRE
ncbi:MAG: hypothetical protein GXO45_05550, partial [Aquificae bacterium]|nr:hypothetical protein [Aquificota bacterium]